VSAALLLFFGAQRQEPGGRHFMRMDSEQQGVVFCLKAV
jgi:hypothetical protein